MIMPQSKCLIYVCGASIIPDQGCVTNQQLTQLSKKCKQKVVKMSKKKNLQSASQIQVSVTEHDILDHLKILRKIDSQGQEKFYQENYVRNSIRRYETCWLPLITTLSDNFEDDLKGR